MRPGLAAWGAGTPGRSTRPLSHEAHQDGGAEPSLESVRLRENRAMSVRSTRSIDHVASRGAHHPVLLSAFSLAVLLLCGSVVLRFTSFLGSSSMASVQDPARSQVAVQESVRSSWNIAVLLEPYCPTQVNYEREATCSAKGLAATSDPQCAKANLGISNAWQYPTSWTVTLPIHAECWRGKPHYKASYTAVFRRISRAMQQLGWRQYHAQNFGNGKDVDSLHAADVIICTTKHYRFLSSVLPCHKFVIIAVDDPATLEREIDYNDKRIIAVLQHTAIIPRSENNLLPLQTTKKLYKGSGHPQIPRHFEWMSPDPLIMTKRCPEIEEASFDKIIPMMPQNLRMRFPLDCGGSEASLALQKAFWKDQSWSPPLVERRVDIMYLGAAHNGSGSILREHRASAVRQLEAMKVKHPHLKIITGVKVPAKEFLNTLLSAKLFVSPFGLGEFSGKDYEAALAGCLVVKPLASKLESYPNIYSADVALEVKVDFSDLEEVTLKALSDLPRSQRMVDRQRQQLREHDVQKLANDLDSLLLQHLIDVSELDDLRRCRDLHPISREMVTSTQRCTKGSGKEVRDFKRVQAKILRNCHDPDDEAL